MPQGDAPPRADGAGPRSGSARWDDAGVFRVGTFRAADGLRPGIYSVRIECTSGVSQPDSDAEGRPIVAPSAVPPGFRPPDAAFPRAKLAAAAVPVSGVRFLPEMEAVARWIEETPRERVVEEAVARIRAGLPERLLVGGLFLAGLFLAGLFLAGLFLAGIRSIKPRPVGFKFHAVMVIAAAHELAFDSPADERLLPFFWALDYFKACQAQDTREGDWSLAAVRPAAAATADLLDVLREAGPNDAARAAADSLRGALQPSPFGMPCSWPAASCSSASPRSSRCTPPRRQAVSSTDSARPARGRSWPTLWRVARQRPFSPSPGGWR